MPTVGNLTGTSVKRFRYLEQYCRARGRLVNKETGRDSASFLISFFIPSRNFVFHLDSVNLCHNVTLKAGSLMETSAVSFPL